MAAQSFVTRRLLIAIALLLLGAKSAFAADTRSYQDWKVDCPKKGACVAHLDEPGVQILVGRVAPNSAVRMALRLAAAAKSGAPVAMRLSDGWQAGLRIGQCTKAYCEAGVTEKSTSIAIAALKRNHDGLIAYQINDKLMLIPFSLAGFENAMKDVSG